MNTRRLGLASAGLTAVAVLVALAMSIGFIATGTAAGEANATDDATVDVTVSTKTMIDIQPESFTWPNVEPGDQGGYSQTASDPFTRAQLENIGSENISNIWFNVTQPTVRPFATGNPSNYDAGNFIALDNKGGTNFLFVDRLEYNESRELVYLTDPEGNTPPDQANWRFGRFRNASFEYFWMVGNTGSLSSSTNCGDLDFYVGDNARTKSSTGTIDFSGGSFQSITGMTAAPNDNTKCLADITLGSGGPGYTAVVDNTTFAGGPVEVRLNRWNVEGLYGGDPSTYNAGYFWNASADASGTPLYPGDSVVAEMNVYVPYGVAHGDASQGTLTVVAEEWPYK